jgi:L-asparaginase II
MDEEANPVLCVQTRNGIIENVFRGIVCVARVEENYKTEIVLSRGNINQMIYPRSANKYVQILPLLESGAADHFAFSDKELAVMCASHNAEQDHVDCVRSILEKIGCKESDLQCGSHTPVDFKSAIQYCLEAGKNLYPFQAPIYNNCSGKHSGMLALCKFLGHSIDNYLSQEHPVQRLIQEAACDVFDISLGAGTLHVGVDGCCAPAFAMPVCNAAMGYARLAKPEYHPNKKRSQAISRMLKAVTSAPVMVHGTTAGALDTVTMTHYKDVFCKRGAAGCHLVGLIKSGLGCSVKIESGADEPKFNVVIEFLRWAGVFSTEDDEEGSIPSPLQRFHCTPNLNCKGEVVGSTTVVPNLFGVPLVK